LGITEILSNLRKVFEKVLVEDEGRFYLVTIYSGGKPEYVLCLPRTAEYLYGKVDLVERAQTLRCLDLLYSPTGLYVFAKDTSEFLEKLKEKMEVLA